MDIRGISTFLEKFKALAGSRKKNQKAIADAVRDKTGISVADENVILERGAVFIKIPPAGKSIIFTKKEDILNELKKILGNDAPSDIR